MRGPFAASVLVVLVVGAPPAIRAQEPLMTLGLGRTFKPESTGYTVAVSFNRTRAVDAAPGPSIVSWRMGRSGGVSLRPSAAANLGSGTKMSANNVLADLLLHYELPAGRHSFIAELGPSAATDKNFGTGLYTSKLLLGVVWEHRPSYPRFTLYPSLVFAGGARTADSLRPSWFARGSGHVQANVVWRGGFGIQADVEAFAVHGDQRFLSNGFYGTVDLTVSKRFPRRARPDRHDPNADVTYGPVGLTVEYRVGRTEPLYQGLNAVMVGLSLYRD